MAQKKHKTPAPPRPQLKTVHKTPAYQITTASTKIHRIQYKRKRIPIKVRSFLILISAPFMYTSYSPVKKVCFNSHHVLMSSRSTQASNASIKRYRFPYKTKRRPPKIRVFLTISFILKGIFFVEHIRYKKTITQQKKALAMPPIKQKTPPIAQRSNTHPSSHNHTICGR